MQRYSHTPAFQHDCNACDYLGTLSDNVKGTRDLYYHDGDYQERGTVIIRHSSRGDDYTSFPRPIAEIMAKQSPDSDYRRALAILSALES